MTFARQAGTAVILVALTLSLQCAGMAALIAWARTSLAPDVHGLGSGRKPHRCADVRIVGELSVRHRDAARCASGAAFPRTRGALINCGRGAPSGAEMEERADGSGRRIG
jgi:hypothetical protein